MIGSAFKLKEKLLLEKEKILVTSILSFSNNVLKGIFSRVVKIQDDTRLRKPKILTPLCSLRTTLVSLAYEDERYGKGYREYWFFSMKDRNLFHRVDTIGIIFKSGYATRENITDGVHEMK